MLFWLPLFKINLKIALMMGTCKIFGNGSGNKSTKINRNGIAYHLFNIGFASYKTV